MLMAGDNLRNIFRKLDVSSRADLARAIEAHRAGAELPL
jgi:DNA-binding CsgD family transcriptional regulator